MLTSKTLIRTWLSHFIDCIGDRVARRVGLSIGVAFVLWYLYSVGNVLVAPGLDLAFGRPTPTASLVSDWAAKMWKPTPPLYGSRSLLFT